MKGARRRPLLPSLCLLAALLLSGCAAPKSMIVLLPEDGKVSGEVTVTNAHGSQTLNQSFQSVEIAGAGGRPSEPVVLQGAAVAEAFGAVRAAMPAPPVRYLLYFKFGSAELVAESQLLLPVIGQVLKERSPAELSVVGHTDSVGSIEFNYNLGLLRATTVAELLARQGAAPVNVATSSRGKTDQMVPTSDQTPEPRNRRAEVTIR